MSRLAWAWCLGSNMAAALLSLDLAAAVVIDALLLPSVVAVLCLSLTAAVANASSPVALAPARPAALLCEVMSRLAWAWCLGSNMAAALLSLGLAAAVVIDTPPVASVLSETAVFCLGLAAAAVGGVSSPGALPPVRPAAGVCLEPAAAVVTVSAAVALAPARLAAGVCLGPAGRASFGEPVLIFALGERAWLLGAAALLDALLPRAWLPL